MTKGILMFLKIVIVFICLLVGVLIYAGLQSSEMHIAREIVIKASAEEIFPFINNSKKANEWMPWAEMDNQLQMSYSGPDEGVGSTSSWNSQGQMGVGQAVVVESTLNKIVKTKLTYTKPMEMAQLAEVSLIQSAEGTTVRWAVSGQNSFIGRVFCLFFNMDKQVGSQFEKGLSKLKTMIEAKQIK